MQTFSPGTILYKCQLKWREFKEQQKDAKLDISDAEGKSLQHLHPTSMRIMENIFSLSVLGATLPKPTEISPVKQK